MDFIDSLFRSFGPEHGALAGGCLIAGGLINQVLSNRQKIDELRMTTEQKNFVLTLDEATVIRKELREAVARLEKELSGWQQKYYSDLTALKEENVKLVADIGALRAQLADIKSRGWIPKDMQEAYL